MAAVRRTVDFPVPRYILYVCHSAALREYTRSNRRRHLQIATKNQLGTCEASRFDSNSNRTSRFDSIRFESDGPIRKFRIAAPAMFAVVP